MPKCNLQGSAYLRMLRSSSSHKAKENMEDRELHGGSLDPCELVRSIDIFNVSRRWSRCQNEENPTENHCSGPELQAIP